MAEPPETQVPAPPGARRATAAMDPFQTSPTATASSLDWRDCVRIMRRRRWPAATVFVVALVFSVVHASTRVPTYQAKVRLLIESAPANITGLRDPLESALSTADFQTQFTILQSRSLARRTMEALGIWDQPVVQESERPAPPPRGSFAAAVQAARQALVWLQTTVDGRPAQVPVDPRAAESADETARIDGFLSGMRLVPLANSRLVDVYYESTNPVSAATYANALVHHFVQQNLEQQFQASSDVNDWLSDRLAEQKKALELSEQTLHAYHQQNPNVTFTSGQASLAVQKLTDLTTAYTRAKTDRIGKEALFNQLQAVGDAPRALDAFPAVLSNPFVQQLKAELVSLQRQQSQLAEKFGDRHPELIKVREQVDAAQARVAGETAKVAESVRRDYFAAQAAETSLGEALEAQKRETLQANRGDVELAVLQRDLESNRQIYEGLLQRMNEFGVTRERRGNTIRIIDSAEVPQVALGVGFRRDLRYGALGGLLLALCVAFLLERVDGHVKTPDQIKAELDVPFLGLVPLIRGSAAESPLVTNAPSGNFGEAFRVLRTNVRLSIPAARARSVVVTSPCAGDGKTLVASNIATALALAEQKVLLVDADLRRPRLHKVFNTAQEPGLSNLLVGDEGARMVRRTTLSALHLLTSGSIPPNPSELLDSHRFKELLVQLGKYYDWVIFDSPPVLPVTDAVVMAECVSAVVLVTAADKTPLQAARSAIEHLVNARAHVIGAVLNRADLDRRAYYYAKYYRHEYETYYTKSAAPA